MLLQKDVRHLPKNYVKLPFKNKNSKEYHEHFDDFFHPLKTEMIDKYISSKYFVGELIYAITGKEASREINVKTDYAMSLLKYINYARVDALVDDIDIEWEQDKLKILSHYKPTTKKSFQYNSFKGYGGKVTYAHLMSLKRHVHSSIDVQGEYYEIYHGQGIRKAHYQTAICAEFANDAIEPDINAIFVNACNPKGINLVDKGKMTDSLGNIMGTTVTWYDFNIFMIDQLTTNTPPLREAFVWFFNTAHKEDLFLKTTSHITDSRARNLIEFIVTMMRDIKGIPGYIQYLANTGEAYALSKEMIAIPAVAVNLQQMLDDSKKEGEIKGKREGEIIGKIEGEIIGVIKTSIGLFALNVSEHLVKEATKFPLTFLEKLKSAQSPEDGYDLYLTSLFETARDCFINSEGIDDVHDKTQLSYSALELIRKTDPSIPISTIFSELKSIAWEIDGPSTT